MDKDCVISVEGLYKKFCRNLKYSMYYGIVDVAANMMGVSKTPSGLRNSEFWALQDIDFELKLGETLGIVGKNGSGKTTLLRLVYGIFPPDRGRITVRGRIGALIAIGAGFHPHMTGRDNVYLSGVLLGMSRTEIKTKLASILDFANIESFIDSPVSMYSSGMRVRLGFSIVVHSHIDVLIADEVLAVGDVGFANKCFNKIGELKQQGVSTLFVAHDLHSISTFANRVLVINEGRQLFIGDVAEGLSIYKKQFADVFEADGEIERVVDGTDDFKVSDVVFNPPLVNNKVQMLNGGDLQITICFEALRSFDDVDIGLVGNVSMPVPYFLQATNHTYNKRIDISSGKGTVVITLKKIALNNIGFYINLAIWEKNRKRLLFWRRKIPLYVEGNALSTGWMHYTIEYAVGQ